MSRDKSLYDPFIETVDLLRRRACSQVGLMTSEDSWEYALWAMLRQVQPDIHIEHVNVNNISDRFSSRPPFSTFSPCAVIVINLPSPDQVILNGEFFVITQDEKSISVYMKQP